MQAEIGQRDQPETAALRAGHRLSWETERWTSAQFDLHEDERRTISSDDVNLAMARPEPPLEDFVPPATESVARQLFAGLTESDSSVASHAIRSAIREPW